MYIYTYAETPMTVQKLILEIFQMMSDIDQDSVYASSP